MRDHCRKTCGFCTSRSTLWSRRRAYDDDSIELERSDDDDDVPDGKEHNKRAADDVSDEKEHKKSRSKKSKKERSSKKSRSKKSSE